MKPPNAPQGMKGDDEGDVEMPLDVGRDESRHEEIRMDDIVGAAIANQSGSETRKFVHVGEELLLGNAAGGTCRHMDDARLFEGNFGGKGRIVAARENVDMEAAPGEPFGELRDVDVLSTTIGAPERCQGGSVFADEGYTSHANRLRIMRT